MKDLLTLDFEGCLKYFRVSMPKKYRSEDASMELLHDAVHLKVSLVRSLSFYPLPLINGPDPWGCVDQG